ncbi:flagellar brake protein [Vibrio maerlii]|uniref:flagellar brake protein n=1 Tax=Vibrio maerlii TaxID=2231648 RepID=UPI000E3CD70C|nr:flagellar brake protein [Vibrio maerlii]
MNQVRSPVRELRTPMQEKVTTRMNSTDALAMVAHGSELHFSITTPVGTNITGTTAFIGTHSHNFILIEVPEMSKEDYQFFFQAGFWLNVRALSQRGEGAIIRFRSQIQHIISTPIPMVMISIPTTMEVAQLRKEPRFEVNLAAKAMVNQNRFSCEVRDLSKNGCSFITPTLSKAMHVGDNISLHISISRQSDVSIPLTGSICNIQSSNHYNRYGIKFEDYGLENAKKLLARLKFDGSKLSLKSN